jgi:hypothetical protein
MENYIVVLFKNKTKKRIIKKFITLKNAELFFRNLIKKNEEVIFEKKLENGQDCVFEVGIIELSNKQLFPVYLTDEIGRNVKVKLEDENMTLLDIKPFKKDEKLFDLQTNKKITSSELVKKYIDKEGVKMISALNNKLIIQINEKFFLFSVKSQNESDRFLDCLSSHFFKIKRTDCIFVKDYSKAQRKYLLSILDSAGIDKKILYRRFTTYPRPK